MLLCFTKLAAFLLNKVYHVQIVTIIKGNDDIKSSCSAFGMVVVEKKQK